MKHYAVTEKAIKAWSKDYQSSPVRQLATLALAKSEMVRVGSPNAVNRVHFCLLGDPVDDHARCVSCGTCRDCKMCLESCPEKAITRIEKADGSWEYVSDPDKCIGCGICAGVCPCGVWSIEDNPEPIKMYSTGAKA